MNTTRFSSLMLSGSLILAASSAPALPAIQLSTIAAGVGGFAIQAETADDEIGSAVSAAGDVNGDGIPDVIVGSRRALEAVFEQGRAYVVFGKTTTGTVQLSAVAAGTGGFMINGKIGDRAGRSVSGAGDVNGDGLADVIVGAEFGDGDGLGGVLNSGCAYVVFGKTGGAPVEVTALGAAGFRILGETNSDQAGYDVSGAGDVNGDGLDDMIVGAPYKDTAVLDEGRAYVVFGRTATAPVLLSAVHAGTGGFSMSGEAISNRAGRAVSGAGDVNGDGLADVLVGAPEAEGIGGGGDHGKAYLVLGKTSGATVELTAIAAGSGGGFAIRGDVNGNNLGASVAGAGDVNGDGLGDVLVGAPFANRAYLVFGKTSSVLVPASDIVNGTGGFSVQGQSSSDRLGHAASAAGDVDGDGFMDLLIGAYLHDTDGAGAGVEQGRSYIVLGKTTTTTVQASAVAGGNGGLILDGTASDDYAGISVSAVGDMNGDGLSDFIVGASRTDTNGTNAGTAFVVFSNATPPLQALYRANFVAGNAPSGGMGSHTFGNDRTQWIDGRAWVDFADGTGSGIDSSSRITLGLRRSDSGTGGLPGGASLAVVANARWSMTTTRTIAQPAVVTLRYIPSEIAGLAESDLRMYYSTSISGPWTLLGSQINDTARNTVSASTGSLSGASNFFILIGLIDNGDANNDGVRNVADLTAMHNQIAGIATLPVGGDGDVDNDGDVDATDCVFVREFLVNGTPLP